MKLLTRLSTQKTIERSIGQESTNLNSIGLSEALAQQLGTAIVSGYLGKDEAIPSTRVICKEYGVSRIVVREAIKMLDAKGMIYTRQSQGTWVQPESAWNLLDRDILNWISETTLSLNLLVEFNQIRVAIEPLAAHLASQRITAVQISKFEGILEKLHKTNGKSIDSEIQFHSCILGSCGNRFYQQFSHFIQTAIDYRHRYRSSHQVFVELDISLYDTVLSNIKNRNSTTAAQSMRTLLYQTI